MFFQNYKAQIVYIKDCCKKLKGTVTTNAGDTHKY